MGVLLLKMIIRAFAKFGNFVYRTTESPNPDFDHHFRTNNFSSNVITFSVHNTNYINNLQTLRRYVFFIF